MHTSWPCASRIIGSSLKGSTTRTYFGTHAVAAELVGGYLTPQKRRCLSFGRLLAKGGSSRRGQPLVLAELKHEQRTSNHVRSFATRHVLTRFEELPEDYRDERGLPFRAKPLDQTEVDTIFGKGVDTGTANRALRMLHGRRVAGTLADPALRKSIAGYDGRLQTMALTWLRTNVPVDEVHAAGLRAEIELQAMESEILADSERLGLYRPTDGEKLPQARMNSRDVYGKSGIDAIHEVYQERMAKQDEAREVARRKQAEEVRSNTGSQLVQRGQSTVELRQPGQNPRLKYYLERAAKVVPDIPPEMSIWQRLWPSAIVVLGVLGSLWGFAHVYVPPTPAGRLWPDMPPAAATMISLITINTAVYAAWHFPPAYRMLNKYFLSVPGYPRALAILGNVFSHQSIRHLGMNMVVLWFMGTRLHDDVGRANFLALYVSSGVLASFTSLASFTIRSNFVTSSLGASGAIAGIISSYLWLHGSEYFKIFYLPPDPLPGVPGFVILSAFIAMDAVGVLRGWKVGSRYDHYAHLGGYAAGIMGATILDHKVQHRRKLETQEREEKLKEQRQRIFGR